MTVSSPSATARRRRRENWLLLAFAVTMCSSAGAVFLLIPEVPPFLRASWRLWCQFLFQLVPFLREWQRFFVLQADEAVAAQLRDNDHKHKEIDEEQEVALPHLARRARYFNALPLMFVSGCFLGGHFAFWVWSLEHTSLLHSLMCVTSYPLFLHLGKWLAFLYFWQHPPSRLESGGLCVSLLGVACLLLGPEVFGSSSVEKKGNPVTIHGDLVAGLSAICMCFYLLIGRRLRSFCPLFLYTTPVVVVSAVFCSVLSAITEDAGFILSEDHTNTKAPSRNLFGFFLDLEYFGIALFLGGAAGVGGHTVLNYLLKWMSPMVVSTALLLEPVVGTVIGMALGAVSPDVAAFAVSTLVGVPVLLLGLGMLVRSEEAAEEPRGGSSCSAGEEHEQKEKDSR